MLDTMQNDLSSNKRWPDGAIVYQIYPRSFKDSNGDGIGDLPGIISKLDYLGDLGINAIWLSPFYTSPMADFGYDVADYCDVDPIFGTLKDAERLIDEAHARSIKIIIDLVPNHTSDEHSWFRQSRQSREDTYSDWYIWRDPQGHDKQGQPIPPNNWVEVITGGPAWEWEPARQQFYLHSFDVKQPDLNWQNPEVQSAIQAAMRFWLDKGIDGFRVDAVNFMAKDPEFTDDPPNPDYVDGEGMRWMKLLHPNSYNWPQMYDHVSAIASVLAEPQYKDSLRFMVTEAYPATDNPIKEYMQFYKSVDPKVAAPFNFEGLGMPWEAKDWQKFLRNFHGELDKLGDLCVPSYAFSNHDQHRLVSRLGLDKARSAAVLLLTLPGMVFIYNGDEIGMKNGNIPPDMVQDPGAKGGSGRDPERTPMQWTAGNNAGFSTAEQTWLPVTDNYRTANVEIEQGDPESFLSLYKALIKLRNSSPALRTGDITVIDTGSSDVLGYTRISGDETFTTLINFSKSACTLKLNQEELGDFVLSSTSSTDFDNSKAIRLQPHEAMVFTKNTK
jgi:alpha-glucosidase